MNEKEMKSFRHPPIIERILGFTTAIDTDLITRQMDAWREIIKNEFPTENEKAISQWNLHIEEKNGAPVMTKPPSLSMGYQSWKNNSDGLPLCCLQTRPDGFYVNLRRESLGSIHSYQELFAMFAKWLPQWIECFEVKTYDYIMLHYVNELSEKITPQFMGKNNNLKIGDALRVFVNFGGRFTTLVPPYECTSTMRVPEKPFAISLKTRSPKTQKDKAPVVHVDLIVRNVSKKSEEADKQINLHDVWAECNEMHEILLEGFSSFFTDKALESFEPI